MKYHKVSDKIPEILVLINKDFIRGLVISFLLQNEFDLVDILSCSNDYVGYCPVDSQPAEMEGRDEKSCRGTLI